MTNSLPWKITMLLIGKPVKHLFLWAIYTMAMLNSQGVSLTPGWKPRKIRENCSTQAPKIVISTHCEVFWTRMDGLRQRTLQAFRKWTPGWVGRCHEWLKWWELWCINLLWLVSWWNREYDITYTWLVVWNMNFPYIRNNNPNWLSYFSEGLKPQTRYSYVSNHINMVWWDCNQLLVGNALSEVLSTSIHILPTKSVAGWKLQSLSMGPQ